MKWVVLTLALLGSLENTSKTVVRGHMKCIPFHTRTAIPIHESTLQKMNQPTLIQSGNSAHKPLIAKAYQVLKTAISRPNHVREDYDLRMSLQFLLSDGSQETFFIDWDKTGLLYRNKFYLIGQKEMDFIEKAFNCKFCNTGQR